MISRAESLWAQPLTLDEIRRSWLGGCDRHLGVELTALGPDWMEGRVPATERTQGLQGDGYCGAIVILAEIAQENVRKMHAAGGVVACGTDESSGAATQRELELLAEAGIPPLDVIRIATFNSAVFLGKADQLGSIDGGKLADLVLLSKDPTADINNAKSIVFVMKDGQIIDDSQLPLAGGKQKRRFAMQ